MLEKVSEQGREEKRGWRLIERMKEERVNRKDGALEETDKDLREQMRGAKKEMEMKIRAKKRKAMEGKGKKGGGQSEKEGDREGERDIKGGRGALSRSEK